MSKRKKQKLNLERDSTEHQHSVREQVRRRPATTPAPHVGTRASATSPDHSRDQSSASPDTDAVPMQRWRTDRIIEECSQYHADKARSFDFDRLSKALGSQDQDFVLGLVMQLMHAGSHFHDGQLLGFMLAVIENIHPRDCIEAMLAAQMAAVHMSMMNCVDEFARLDRTIDPLHANFRQEMADRALNKLSRTFATLVGALKNHRTGGEQKLTVGHLSVSTGSQAIVGTVNQPARDVLPEKTPNATPVLTDARQPPMEILGESERIPIPLRKKSGT
jgi:hypothetical protein